MIENRKGKALWNCNLLGIIQRKSDRGNGSRAESERKKSGNGDAGLHGWKFESFHAVRKHRPRAHSYAWKSSAMLFPLKPT